MLAAFSKRKMQKKEKYFTKLEMRLKISNREDSTGIAQAD